MSMCAHSQAVCQVEEWDDSLIQKENDAKDSAKILLFSIDDMTRGVMSVAEAAYYIGLGRTVVLVVQQYPVDAKHPEEAKDLNRGRSFLKSIASSHQVAVFDTVEGAVSHIVGVVAM
eukprot:gene12670-15901_t